MRKLAGLAAVMAIALVPAPASAGPGALGELTGPGSCFTQGFQPVEDCPALAGADAQPNWTGSLRAFKVSGDGTSAYLAANRPSAHNPYSDRASVLYVFARDPATGRLTQLPGPAGCLSAIAHAGCTTARALRGLARISITRDGQFLYTASDPSGIGVFQRDPATGALTQLGGRRGCVNATGREGCTRVRGMKRVQEMTLEPGDRRLMVDAGPFFRLDRDATTGTLRAPSGKRRCLAPFNRACTLIPPLDDLPMFTRNGRFAFAASGDSDAVVGFSYDARTGALEEVGRACAKRSVDGTRCKYASGGFHPFSLSPDNRWVYLADTVLDDIVSFRVSPTTGAVHAISTTFGCKRPTNSAICRGENVGWGLLMPPGGAFGYQVLGDEVLAYSRDAGSGKLAFLPGTDACSTIGTKQACTHFTRLEDIYFAAMAPDGRNVYVVSPRTLLVTSIGS
jgi:hypothetical protein